MDLNFFIMGLGALILVIAPILYFQRKQKIEQNKTKSYLDNLAKAQGLIFSQYEFWDTGYAIGFDTSKKVLCYLACTGDKQDYTLINLVEVERCSVINDHRDIQGNRVIDQIRLAYTLKSSRAHKSLLFYDREDNLNFTNELLLAKKWENIISSNIGSKQLVEMC